MFIIEYQRIIGLFAIQLSYEYLINSFTQTLSSAHYYKIEYWTIKSFLYLFLKFFPFSFLRSKSGKNLKIFQYSVYRNVLI